MKKLGNLFKYDESLCVRCEGCARSCDYNAISFIDDFNIDLDKCLCCKNCITSCTSHALYYNIESPSGIDKSHVAILPAGTSRDSLNENYEKILETNLAEKLRILETAFYMDNMYANIINNSLSVVIISVLDVEKNYLEKKYQSNCSAIYSLPNAYDITMRLEKLKGISYTYDLFGVPFEMKLDFDNYKTAQCTLFDIPYTYSPSYNVLDLLYTFSQITQLKPSTSLDSIHYADDFEITFKNNLFEVRCLITRDFPKLSKMANFKPHFVIFDDCSNHYCHYVNLLDDEEVNEIYKKYLKRPLNNKLFK